jgi:hypothetical protein
MTEWNDLERLWQSLPAHAAPAIEELKRQRRWRWFTSLTASTEIVTAAAAVAMAVFILVRGDPVSIVIGVATLIFVAVVSAVSIWARSLQPVHADDPVMRTVEKAVRHARVGVRFAFATLWSVCASLVFLAVMALAFDFEDNRGSGYVAIGIALVWVAVWLGGAILYLRKRTADLAQLEALKASLAQGV